MDTRDKKKYPYSADRTRKQRAGCWASTQWDGCGWVFAIPTGRCHPITGILWDAGGSGLLPEGGGCAGGKKGSEQSLFPPRDLPWHDQGKCSVHILVPNNR